jgi:hypothetical protein
LSRPKEEMADKVDAAAMAVFVTRTALASRSCSAAAMAVLAAEVDTGPRAALVGLEAPEFSTVTRTVAVDRQGVTEPTVPQEAWVDPEAMEIKEDTVEMEAMEEMVREEVFTLAVGPLPSRAAKFNRIRLRADLAARAGLGEIMDRLEMAAREERVAAAETAVVEEWEPMERAMAGTEPLAQKRATAARAVLGESEAPQ